MIQNQQTTIFHLAFVITDIKKAKDFYLDGLGCQIGRENKHSAIFNLYGHQIIAHITKETLIPQQRN